MITKTERLDLLKRLYKKQIATRQTYPLQDWEVELPAAKHVEEERAEEFWIDGELNFDMEVVRRGYRTCRVKGLEKRLQTNLLWRRMVVGTFRATRQQSLSSTNLGKFFWTRTHGITPGQQRSTEINFLE